MAKYCMTLALLLCLALENNNIYARSHPSGSDEAGSLPVVRAHPHSRHQPHQHSQQLQHQHVQQLQQHHTRQQRDRQPKRIAPDPSSEEEELHQLHYEQRLRRHLRRQRQHQLEQERSYHRVSATELKTSPNLWQLLSQGYQFDDKDQAEQQSQDLPEMFPPMFNDAPADDLMQQEDPQDYIRNELHQSLAEPAPPIVLEDSTSTHKASSHTNGTASRGCPKCESNRQVEHITEEELRRLRIEFVKQQILEKLRLKESPNVSAVELPRPIFEGVTLQNSEESTKNKDYDDYYARTNQKFILLQRGK